MQNVRTGSLEHAKSLTGEANFPHHMEVPTDPNDDGLTLRMAATLQPSASSSEFHFLGHHKLIMDCRFLAPCSKH